MIHFWKDSDSWDEKDILIHFCNILVRYLLTYYFESYFDPFMSNSEVGSCPPRKSNQNIILIQLQIGHEITLIQFRRVLLRYIKELFKVDQIDYSTISKLDQSDILIIFSVRRNIDLGITHKCIKMRTLQIHNYSKVDQNVEP